MDNTKSDLTEEEIKAIYGGEGLSEENVIKYNYKELSEIAMGQENRRKEWLRQFLDQKEQSPEKASLRQLIKQ